MNHSIIPPHEPKQPEPVHPPMVYVKEPSQWEYKHIARDLKKEGALSKEELNALGAEGWEMSGVAGQPPLAYYYFKRLVEKQRILYALQATLPPSKAQRQVQVSKSRVARDGGLSNPNKQRMSWLTA